MFEKIYDGWAANYNSIFDSVAAGLDECRLVVEHGILPYVDGGSVFELGSGTGLVSRAIAEAGFSVTGVEISASSIEQAQALCSSFEERVDFVHADFMNEKVAGSFDAVVAVGDFLTHFLSADEQAAAVRKMVEHMNDRGCLCISFENYDDLIVSEEQDAISTPRKLSSNSRTGFFIRRRIWHGEPRTGRFTCNYYTIIDGREPVIVSMDRKAVLRTFLEELLRDMGLKYIEWKLPDATGYYQPLCIARRYGSPASDTIFTQTK